MEKVKVQFNSSEMNLILSLSLSLSALANPPFSKDFNKIPSPQVQKSAKIF